ncbi:hypothetical protein BLNAU_11373 [Blattamonas nauphoetae]|uniref:Uncharacterized protein n=1 Tax=Blattamonas nauphoetae TaxID=2049346 RepID=A0ABQ9XS32_9EUKA|nr:hypothetical protein BLNAU_11373 [Blattamonas nauphoetae]
MPEFNRNISGNQILFQLVPTRDGSCNGFSESIVPLLTSSNEELATSTLSLLDQVVRTSTKDNRFAFLETGFFARLPKSFFEQEIHLLAQPELLLIRIVQWFSLFSHPLDTISVCYQRRLSMESFQKIFIGKFFHPIRPFLEFICKHRHRIDNPSTFDFFTDLIGTMITNSPYLQPMTQIVLSSSVALTFTDCLISFEKRTVVEPLLQHLLSGFYQWQGLSPDVQKRGRQLMDKLCKEGLSDVSELHLQSPQFGFIAIREVSKGAQVIDKLGGNTSFHGRNYY